MFLVTSQCHVDKWEVRRRELSRPARNPRRQPRRCTAQRLGPAERVWPVNHAGVEVVLSPIPLIKPQFVKTGFRVPRQAGPSTCGSPALQRSSVQHSTDWGYGAQGGALDRSS